MIYSDFDRPKLSVILPCRNEAEAIEACLLKIKAVFVRENINGEIIVSDSSTDQSPLIAQKYNVVLIKHGQPGYGRGMALLEECEGALRQNDSESISCVRCILLNDPNHIVRMGPLHEVCKIQAGWTPTDYLEMHCHRIGSNCAKAPATPASPLHGHLIRPSAPVTVSIL